MKTRIKKRKGDFNMNFFREIIRGVIVGIGAITPGVSGGVIATVFGIYEPIMNALANFFKDIKTHTRFLMPYALGGVLGFLFFSGVIDFFITHAETQVLFLFAGIVIGGFPALIKESNSEGFRYRYLFFSAAAYLLMTASAQIFSHPIGNSLLKYFVGGSIYSAGSIIPGISASFILINMGIYKEILSGFMSPVVFIPFLTGFILTALLLIKGVNFMFKKFHGYAYYTVIGLLSASIVTAMPALSKPLLDIVILILGILLGFLFINP